MNTKIRKAKKSDSKEITRLIKELAEFEKLTPPDVQSQKRLLRNAFGKNCILNILVAEKNNLLVGYAFYFFTYSTFLAKRTLFLEDIYIMKKYRNKGIGKLFFDKLIQTAKEKKCGRMEWIVLDWNKNAINFYEKLGARQMKEWKFFRKEL
jgi:GNAT superfamily N-acetyltransferase